VQVLGWSPWGFARAEAIFRILGNRHFGWQPADRARQAHLPDHKVGDCFAIRSGFTTWTLAQSISPLNSPLKAASRFGYASTVNRNWCADSGDSSRCAMRWLTLFRVSFSVAGSFGFGGVFYHYLDVRPARHPRASRSRANRYLVNSASSNES